MLPTLAQCYDSVVADRLAVDRLRGHADPMEQTNLENEIEAGVVEGLLAAAEAHSTIGQRWFRAKAGLLGLERLDTIDIYGATVDAPLLSWEEGRELVVGMFAELTPALGAETARFFDERRIDAEPRRGKPSGAFCLWPSTRVPGFVFLNWRGELFDLLALTHELGHGTHFALATQAQDDLSFMAGLTVAEDPLTFAEPLLTEHLLATNQPLGKAVLARTLDHSVVVAFMASAFARFEQQAYAVRADGQALNAERLGGLCDEALAPMRGDAMSDEQGSFTRLWASMPHFVHERFYTYAYTFAFLLSAGLLARSREPGFGERYERFLAAGGSAAPAELMRILEVDLSDPEIWNDGFAVLEGWIDRIA